MQRKTSFPVANCSIKMPECNMSTVMPEVMQSEEDSEQQQRRQQLINFGHSQWGFNNWSWSVTKQELDFVDFNNGKYCVGVVAFVSITVKSFEIHRENIGYATSVANSKGFAIYKSRKCAVTNALRETLLSFGGSVATELTELIESHRVDFGTPTSAPEPLPENNQNIANRPTEPKNSPLNRARKEPDNLPTNVPAPRPVPTVKNAAPMAKAHPMPANLAQPARPTLVAPRPPPPAPRPNSNDTPKSIEEMSEEEARVERKRRQRMAQEEFRQKQMIKQGTGLDEKQDLSRNSSSFDKLLMDIPTQEIIIEASGAHESGKRKSPAPDGGGGGTAKRRGSVTRLDIVQTD